MIEFKEWPKTPRLMRNITITEKIDGTNAAIGIVFYDAAPDSPDDSIIAYVTSAEGIYGVYAQSRTRLITPGKMTDNYGFAGWVRLHAVELVSALGDGLHYGEWWGNGIQRRYDMPEKWFSLFNVDRFKDIETSLNLNTVPVLYRGPNDTVAVAESLKVLRADGSVAAPGFMNPEGICVYSYASRTVSKVTLDHNDAGKWEAAS